MDMNSFANSDPTRASTPGAPYLSASQASTLLRSGLAIAGELIGNAFDEVCRAVQESLETKWDFGVGGPLVQRLLFNKRHELRSAFLSHLKHRQDQVLSQALTRSQPSPQGTVMQLTADTMSLVDAVTATSDVVVDRAASKMRGVMEEAQRDLHVVVTHIVGRSQLRQGDDPFGPEVFMHALLSAGEDLALHAEAWDFFMQAFERPMAEEIGRIHVQLLEHFQRHGVDVRAIRRELALRQAATRGPGGAPGEFGATVTGANTGLGGLGGPSLGGLGGPSLGGGGGGDAGYGIGGGGGGGGGYGSGSGNTGYGGGAGGGRYGGAYTAQGGVNAPFAAAGAMGIGAPRADPGLVLNNLMARLQANARDYRPPQLPSPGPAGAPLLEALNELQQLGLEGFSGAAFAG
ncbi:MAG TPA: DUF1631 family protein, partial [Burkholderiaceae bacterium]|nr:DUF1631 family protein [Burkholderiaceae bacterium]